MRMRLLFIPLLLLLVVTCKPKLKEEEAQILGTRYSKIDQFITSSPGSTKKDHRVVLIYALEEVNVIETVTHEKKDYFKLSTVTGKEGFARSSNFSEAVIFVAKEGLNAFRKPTLTAGTKGKLEIGSICFVKEIQGEWSNVDCLTANITPDNVEDWYDVWIQSSDDRISRDPLLGQTALLLRDGYKLLNKANKSSSPERAKLILAAKEKLTKASEKEDILLPTINSVLVKFEMMDEQPQVPNPPSVETENTEQP